MKTEKELWQQVIACILVMVLTVSAPFETLAQSADNRGSVLENGTPVILCVSENFNSNDKADTGTISAIVNNDVYSADGTRILIKDGTPAYIEFSAESNGHWGQAGKISLTHATTRTIDNKRVSLRLSSSKKGGSKLGGVIILSVLFFPIGLVSGCMKGSMPKIKAGTTYNASVVQDITVRIIPHR